MTRSFGALGTYLGALGVPRLPPRTFPFDPGYDAGTVAAHLAQSGHLMAGLKLSMASWQLASEAETRRKVAAARGAGVPLVAGGAAYEVSLDRGLLDAYFALAAEMGVSCIEAGEGFTCPDVDPARVCAQAAGHGLQVQFEVGRKDEGPFRPDRVEELVTTARAWLDAGAVRVVVEARESAAAVGLFDAEGLLDTRAADRLTEQVGLDLLCFEAPTKSSQFALLRHFGRDVVLSNVRLEELLRVEIFRHGLHADAYGHPGLELDDSVAAQA